MTIALNPTELRKSLRQRRNALSSTVQAQHAQLALTSLKLFLSTENPPSLRIAAFLSQDGELDTSPAIHHLWHFTNHQLYLPTLETKPDWHMGFAEYRPNSEMKNNRFGIPEPHQPHQSHISGQELDLVLMPLVGFDSNGNRMGMGGGYYDRTFAFKQSPSNSPNSTVLMGWAHHCQQTAQLPSEPWDIPLDAIITEQGLTMF